MRGLIAEIVSAHHQVTVVDMEAGLEHFSRSGGTLRYVDELLLITEMDRKAFETTRRAYQVAKQLGIGRIGLIGNKVRDEVEQRDLEGFCNEVGVELVAALPFDEAARQADRRGVSLFDAAPASTTVRKLTEVASWLETEFAMLPSRPAMNAEATMTPPNPQKRFPECD